MRGGSSLTDDADEEKYRALQRQKHEDAKAFVFNRQKSYQDVFKKDSQSALAVLSDLAKFCRAGESTFEADPRLHALKEGRREVWLRIQEQLEFSSEELWRLISRKGA